MKKSMASICMVMMILILSSGMALARNGKLGNQAGMNGGGTAVALLPYETPSDDEIAALTHMAEEEKLARDVYNVLYDIYEIPAFANIAKAEQRHMDAVISLLDKYGLENPATLAAGQFNNADLQDLYDDLISSGQENEEDALLVGMTIEDVDIYDLRYELTLVDNEDISTVFGNLLKGSENHMRAFASLLAMYGYDPYEAQFLTQEEIDEILATARTQGRKTSMGNGSAAQKDQNNMIDADGDGICDFLQQ